MVISGVGDFFDGFHGFMPVSCPLRSAYALKQSALDGWALGDASPYDLQGCFSLNIAGWRIVLWFAPTDKDEDGGLSWFMLRVHASSSPHA